MIDSMIKNGVIEYESDGGVYGHKWKSRGWYIVDTYINTYYLHHDGEIKLGVGSDSEKPAFWPTRKEAELFFEEWKQEQLK